ncbi:MAG: hypothetical protein DRG33_03895 [Deltaproteobacteria bacterium]|nr:MAG: hypothetical protein DRG33_03895 [Deltaproteobacteria bacterium]
MAFKLGVVEDVYKPEDLVSIKVERVKNQFGEPTNKFVLYVDKDVFGLLSASYTFISSKELADLVVKNTDMVLSAYNYSNGSLTCYFTTKTDSEELQKQERFAKLAKLILSIPDEEVVDLHVRPGIFFTNNYTGSARLTWGAHIIVQCSDKGVYTIPLTKLLQTSQSHLPSAIEFVESLKVDKPDPVRLLESISAIPRDEFLSLVSTYISQKQLDDIVKTLETIEKDYDTVYLLACIAWKAPHKVSVCLQIVSDILKLKERAD